MMKSKKQRKTKKPYRDGRVHVYSRMCDTCIFRPGNLMQLNEGRVEEMVARATKADSVIICHDTLSGLQSVCHGFFKLHPTQPLQIADRLGYITFVEPGVKA